MKKSKFIILHTPSHFSQIEKKFFSFLCFCCSVILFISFGKNLFNAIMAFFLQGIVIWGVLFSSSFLFLVVALKFLEYKEFVFNLDTKEVVYQNVNFFSKKVLRSISIDNIKEIKMESKKIGTQVYFKLLIVPKGEKPVELISSVYKADVLALRKEVKNKILISN